MKRSTVTVVAISGCVLGPACQSIVGIEDRVEAIDDAGGIDGATSVDGGGGGTADGDPCAANPSSCLDPDAAPPAGCPTGCLPPAPVGWTGPSATYDGAESGKPKDCPTTYTEKRVEAHQGMTATPAVCECGAGTVSGRFCSADVITYVAGCNMGGASKQTTLTTTVGCYTTVVSGPAFYEVTTPVLTAGTCNFANAKTTLPPPSFQKVDVACGLAQTTACENRADCVAAPFPEQPYGRLCIHKDGEVACPSLDYATRFVSYKKLEDTRACTTCTATPAGAGCGSKWGNRFKIQDCGNALPPANDKDAEGCYAYNGPGTIVDIVSMKPGDATCTATGGAASGTASSAEPVTFCCNN